MEIIRFNTLLNEAKSNGEIKSNEIRFTYDDATKKLVSNIGENPLTPVISRNIDKLAESLSDLKTKKKNNDKRNNGEIGEVVAGLLFDCANLNDVIHNHPFADLAVENPIGEIKTGLGPLTLPGEIISVKSSISYKSDAEMVRDVKSVKMSSLFYYLVFACEKYNMASLKHSPVDIYRQISIRFMQEMKGFSVESFNAKILRAIQEYGGIKKMPKINDSFVQLIKTDSLFHILLYISGYYSIFVKDFRNRIESDLDNFFKFLKNENKAPETKNRIRKIDLNTDGDVSDFMTFVQCAGFFYEECKSKISNTKISLSLIYFNNGLLHIKKTVAKPLLELSELVFDEWVKSGNFLTDFEGKKTKDSVEGIEQYGTGKKYLSMKQISNIFEENPFKHHLSINFDKYTSTYTTSENFNEYVDNLVKKAYISSRVKHARFGDVKQDTEAIDIILKTINELQIDPSKIAKFSEFLNIISGKETRKELEKTEAELDSIRKRIISKKASSDELSKYAKMNIPADLRAEIIDLAKKRGKTL